MNRFGFAEFIGDEVLSWFYEQGLSPAPCSRQMVVLLEVVCLPSTLFESPMPRLETFVLSKLATDTVWREEIDPLKKNSSLMVY